MKVLMINGSPHREGCTFTALGVVAESLKAEGIDSEIMNLGNSPIRGCTACMQCKTSGSGRCAFDDGQVNIAIEKLEQSDGLIIGSPVHYAGPSGFIVPFCDRLFYAGSHAITHKPSASVSSARRAGNTATIDVLNKYFQICGAPIVPSKYWPMVFGMTPEDVKKDVEGMQTMRMLGKNMAWLLNAIEAGKKAGIEPPASESPDARMNFIR